MWYCSSTRSYRLLRVGQAMTVADLIEILEGVNPNSPVLIDCSGFIVDADSVEVRNGITTIQGS